MSLQLHHLEFDVMPGEKARWELHKDAATYFEQFLDAAPSKTADFMATYLPFKKSS